MASLQTLERLMEEERNALELHKAELRSLADPEQRQLFSRLAELREQAVTALQSYMSEARPIAEVRRQINEMF